MTRQYDKHTSVVLYSCAERVFKDRELVPEAVSVRGQSGSATGDLHLR